MTFHGLSSPDDLKQMWKELKHDSDSKDINVIWDYTSPEQIQPGPNILNILYSPETPKETGHYEPKRDTASFAIGSFFDPNSNNILSAMTKADKRMYDDKELYYAEHPEKKR